MYKIAKIAGMLGLEFKFEPNNEELQTLFNEHVTKYSLSYATQEEYEFRFDIFKQKHQEMLEAMEEGNGGSTYTLAHNKFSTMTEHEFKRYLGKKPQMHHGDRNPSKLNVSSDANSEPIDWRTHGAVNPVQNQGQCGSCWAFSSAAAMEGAYFLKHGQLLKLSEQQWVDCDEICLGCNGGLEVYAFFYAKSNPIELLADYPYTAKDESCKASASKGKVSSETWVELYPGVESELKAALDQKPTCVSVSAANINFQLYTGGILNTESCIGQLDHAVTAVGWGTEGGQEYLIVRNSWGADWGEDGYIRMALNGDGRGVCGVLLDSTMVNVV